MRPSAKPAAMRTEPSASPSRGMRVVAVASPCGPILASAISASRRTVGRSSLSAVNSAIVGGLGFSGPARRVPGRPNTDLGIFDGGDQHRHRRLADVGQRLERGDVDRRIRVFERLGERGDDRRSFRVQIMQRADGVAADVSVGIAERLDQRRDGVGRGRADHAQRIGGVGSHGRRLIAQ